MITPKKAPYANTEVSIEQTQAEINRLLRTYGIVDTQWTTAWSIGKVSLRFITEGKGGKKVAFEISPPSFSRERRSWNAKRGCMEKITAPNWPQSLRMLLYYLKAKLEAVAYGLTEVEQEFLAEMVVLDAAGRETTVGKMVAPAIEGGRINLPQLDPPRPASEPIDAEYRASA